MATHSSILAWGIPRRKDPGELQSMGSQRFGHDLATKPPPWWLKEPQQFWGPGQLRNTSSGREQKQAGYFWDARTPQVRENLKRLQPLD